MSSALLVAFLNTQAGSLHKTTDLTQARRRFDKLSTTGVRPKVRAVKNYTIDGVPVREYSAGTEASWLIFFHGGGYVLGSLNSHDIFCRRLCKFAGLNVLAVGYALAPERKYPTQIRQGERVINALARRVKQPMYIGGDSAGGTIAAAIASKNKHIQAQILFYPALNGRMKYRSITQNGIRKNYLTKEMLLWFRDQYLNGPEELDDPLANPILTTPRVPTFLAVGTRDPLLNESTVYADMLQRHKIAHQLVVVNNALHGFMQFPRRFGYTRVITELNAFIAEINKAKT